MPEPKTIGPSFSSELQAADLLDLPFSWSPEDGTITYGSAITAAQEAAIQAVYDAHDPTKPAPIPIPQTVSAAQGGIALIQAGLMDSVQAVVDAADTPAEVKWAWTRAQDWQRNSPALAYLSQRAGISEKQMDDLFVSASQILA